MIQFLVSVVHNHTCETLRFLKRVSFREIVQFSALLFKTTPTLLNTNHCVDLAKETRHIHLLLLME